jgi:hypothetical protein
MTIHRMFAPAGGTHESFHKDHLVLEPIHVKTFADFLCRSQHILGSIGIIRFAPLHEHKSKTYSGLHFGQGRVKV